MKAGATVKIVLKADRRTGKLTEGGAASDEEQFHLHGIKAMGQVGRVKEIAG